MPFEVAPSRVDEESFRSSPLPPPQEWAAMLAREKAQEVRTRESGALILGADTIVVVEGEDGPKILEKPVDAEDARRMLTRLSAGTHAVYTGLALLVPEEGTGSDRIESEVVETRVAFRPLTPAMIDAYIATGEPFDKAGAYGIQGGAAAFVEAISGDYFNVVGLPVQTVGRMLERVGIEWWRGPGASL